MQFPWLHHDCGFAPNPTSCKFFEGVRQFSEQEGALDERSDLACCEQFDNRSTRLSVDLRVLLQHGQGVDTSTEKLHKMS